MNYFWGFGFFGLLIWLAFAVLGIYVAVLTIKVLTRAIAALDIYLEKNKNNSNL